MPAHRAEREDGEAEVVHAQAPVDVAEPPEAHDEDGGDDEEAEDHPQQVVGVAGREGVDVDPAEDVRQGDQQDRGVDGRHQDAERRVREGDPLVAVGGRGGRGYQSSYRRGHSALPEHALRFALTHDSAEPERALRLLRDTLHLACAHHR
jgi:hypothetical protein